MSRRSWWVTVAASVAIVLFAPSSAHAASFPARIDVPDGFQPEGIAVGRGSTFYTGSLTTGGIYRGDLRTGEGDVIHPGGAGPSVGLAVDNAERVWVAGGPTGTAWVIDGDTGALLASFTLATGATFINDVEVTRTGAYLTDSFNPVLYRIPLDLGTPETIPLTGDLVYQTGFNVNGIEATPNGKTLILVQSNTGKLFATNPDTGVTSEIDLGADDVASGDGLLLAGKTLYVLQNFMNRIAVVRLSPDLSSGEVVRTIASTGPDGFDIPTTLDRFGSRLYAVNARFTTTPEATTAYWITSVRAR